MTTTISLFDARAERAALGDAISTRLAAVIDSGAFILGPAVANVEEGLSDYLGPGVYSIGVASGTAALELALRALRVGSGDEVITTPFTWISSASVGLLVGADVVFADIDRGSYCLDVDSAAAAMTARTRAVIGVSIFGRVPDYRRLREAADAAGARFGTRIAVIEDGAQSFGGRGDDGVLSCASEHAHLSTTRFFPSKPLSCYGDGGAVFTRDAALAGAVRSLRAHGKDAASGLHTAVGTNARLDALQAAVVSAKLERFGALVGGRAAAGARYRALLGREPRVRLPEEGGGGARHVFGVYTVRVRERDGVAARLRAAGVACGAYYKVCVHQQPVFAGRARGRVTLPVAEELSRHVLALPVHAFLGEEDQARVVAVLLGALDDLGVTEPPP